MDDRNSSRKTIRVDRFFKIVFNKNILKANWRKKLEINKIVGHSSVRSTNKPNRRIEELQIKEIWIETLACVFMQAQLFALYCTVINGCLCHDFFCMLPLRIIRCNFAFAANDYVKKNNETNIILETAVVAPLLGLVGLLDHHLGL